jgi:hypothetical protein
MVPLLLLQFAYKLIWLGAVGYPLWSAHRLDQPMALDLMRASIAGAVADLIAIPWRYAVRRYVLGFFRR